jgi:hypothetical protein
MLHGLIHVLPGVLHRCNGISVLHCTYRFVRELFAFWDTWRIDRDSAQRRDVGTDPGLSYARIVVCFVFAMIGLPPFSFLVIF